jgi:hypothetical protein
MLKIKGLISWVLGFFIPDRHPEFMRFTKADKLLCLKNVQYVSRTEYKICFTYFNGVESDFVFISEDDDEEGKAEEFDKFCKEVANAGHFKF